MVRMGPVEPAAGLHGATTEDTVRPPRGVERPRRVVRFTCVIHRRVRALGRTYGPRRLRRQSQPALDATQGEPAPQIPLLPAHQRRLDTAELDPPAASLSGEPASIGAFAH